MANGCTSLSRRFIRMDDLEEVKDFCDQYHVELFVREVVLVESDAEVLGI